uniref:Transmembrane protein 144 n=1 Tax=Plectus sambesii TaxID=2011161 RepID=A0A914W2X0_9BILA
MDNLYFGIDNTYFGLACCLFSGLFFGSMFGPLKKHETRDGFFVQWIQSACIFVVGMVVNMLRNQPRFELGAALGGLIFATSNIMTIPIVNNFGAGLGILIWGSVQITFGWATARFGLFGLREQIPNDVVMNYIGVALTLGSGLMFGLVKSESNTPRHSTEVREHKDVEYTPCNPPIKTVSSKEIEQAPPKTLKTKLFYLSLAIITGLLLGQILTPVVYVQDNVEGASHEGLDYVFAHFCGIFASSTIFFIIYCIIKKSRPFVNAEIILPSVIYGTMWALAMVAWFISNKLLSQAISFPIVTRIPGVIAACWDVFYFKSIKGKRNLTLLAVAICVALVGVVLVGLSK